LKLAITFDRLRWEEKALREEALAAGMEAELLDARPLLFEISGGAVSGLGDVVVQRCISHYRSLFLSRVLEGLGQRVVNSYAVSELCGNKLAATMALAAAGVPTPKTMVALSSEAAGGAAERLGYPVVLKPFTGSWGRMVSVVRDKATLDSIVELREELPNPIEHMYYIQEFVERPPRDIRAIVAGDEILATVHRYAPEGDWKTNVARGGVSKAFQAEPDLQEVLRRAASAVGGGVLGVDAMESKEGYLVHEVNSSVEFRGAQSAVTQSIAAGMVSYLKGANR
jgi:[lysine-biosynthesis-protein LysW]---L-2-aminoadipate ligase